MDCNCIHLACFRIIIIIYDAEYQLFLSNLFELCKTVVSFGLVSEVKRNILCCVCPLKEPSKENV